MNDIFQKYRRQKDVEKKSKIYGRLLFYIITAIAISFLVYNAFRYFQYYNECKRETDLLQRPIPVKFKSRINQLLITIIDVEYGFSALIETPNGKKILVDAGEGTSPDLKYLPKTDAGRIYVYPYLVRRGIKELDAVILTSPKTEHYGGLLHIIKNIPVKIFYSCGFNQQTDMISSLLNIIQKKNIEYILLKKNDSIDLGTDVYCKILYANDKPDNLKNASSVFLLQYKNNKFIFPGDIESNRERQICRDYGRKIQADFLLIADHGGVKSTSKLFLDYVKPKISAVSLSQNNTAS